MIIINNMIKKLSILILSLFIITFLNLITNSNFINKSETINNISAFFDNRAFAETPFKINTINFDNSDSIIFLGTTGLNPSVPLSVNKGKLSNPDRIYFDINDAVITKPNSSYEFSNSVLKQIKIAQFSTNPAVVRVVITYSSSTNPNQIRLLKLNGNLIIKLKNETPVQDYLTQVYREFKDSPFDFYEKTTVKQEGITTPPSPPQNNDLFNQIQQAFNETTTQMASSVSSSTKEQPVRNNPPIKESKLKSRYYIDKMFLRQGNVLISGIGVVNLEKMIYLSEPSRVVFDMPNTVVAPDLRGKEIKVSENETIKIGQFEPTKARVVITTPTPLKYRPIYSFDLQSILIANDDRMAGVKLFNTTSNITSMDIKTLNETTSNLVLDFTNPIVHSIRRDSTKLELNLYNATEINVEEFKKEIRNTVFYNSKVDYLPYQGLKITIPIKKETTVDCYESLNATQLKLTVKTPLEQHSISKPSTKVTKPNKYSPVPQSITHRIIVIDPGHGGSDTGALKAGIAEKDINLDIAKKVASILTNKGTHVELTRWGDATVSLQERVELANAKKTDIFVSIHINSSVKPEVHGIETHYYTESGYEVAKILHKSIMSKVSGVDRGLFKSRFYVINHTAAPSVLLELGFLSNDNERNSLLTEDRKQKSAEAIADGIIDFLKTQPKR